MGGTFIDDPERGGSEPGAYAAALRHSVNITQDYHEPVVATAGSVTRHPGHTSPHSGATSPRAACDLPEPGQNLSAFRPGSGFCLQHGADHDAAHADNPQTIGINSEGG